MRCSSKGHLSSIVLLAGSFFGIYCHRADSLCSSSKAFLGASRCQQHSPKRSLFGEMTGSTNSLKKLSMQSKHKHTVRMASTSDIETVASNFNNADDGETGLGAWIPLASVSALSGLGPTRITAMGLELVVWQQQVITEMAGKSSPKARRFWPFGSRNETSGKWSVLSDACPHRLAPLSLGRVVPETGCIECPYHGWQFDSEGKPTHIPQLNDDIKLTPSLEERASSKSYPVHLTGDLLWVFLPSSIHGESFPQSLLPEDYYPGLSVEMQKGAVYHVQEMPASMDFLTENAMDPAHFPFAHHGVIASREDASAIPMTIPVSNFTHVTTSTSYMRKGEYRERIYGFQRPSLIYTEEKDFATNEWKPGVQVFLSPIHEGRTRLITSVGSSKLSKLPLPVWIIHLLATRLFEGDMLVHDAERFARGQSRISTSAVPTTSSLNYFMPTTSDAGVIAFRKWYDEHGFSKAPPHTFGPASPENLRRLTRQEQVNPWSIHTKTCSHCRTALRRARSTQFWSVVVGSVGSLLLRQKSLTLSVSSFGMGLLLFAISRKLVMLLEGSPHPSDVSDQLLPE